MEHGPEHRVDNPDRFHPDYKEKETAFRAKAAELWDAEAAARARIRADVSLTDEQRQDKYMAAYSELQQKLDAYAEEIDRDVSRSIVEATSTLYKGTGPQFSEHLTNLASVPEERLEEVFNTAVRSGQKDLERAAAAVAYERGQRGLFNRWAERDPERAEAIRRIQGTPGALQFVDRTSRAMKPPKAKVEDLMPSEADRQRAAEAAAAKNRPRVEFFGRQGTQRVGRRVS